MHWMENQKMTDYCSLCGIKHAGEECPLPFDWRFYSLKGLNRINAKEGI